MIKLFGYLLMTVGLIDGSLSAITAYRPKLSLPDDQLVGLELTAAAGVQPGTDHTAILPRGTILSAEGLALLRSADEEHREDRLVVKQFSFPRWDMKWAALGAVATLGLGAFIVKGQTRRQIRMAAEAAPDATGTKGPTPEIALQTIRERLDSLRAELAGITDPVAKDAKIIEVVGELNAVQVAAIVDQRNAILGRLGMGGLASFMDRFASAERALNRAWSAAADGITDEAELCLARAVEVVPEAQARLRGA